MPPYDVQLILIPIKAITRQARDLRWVVYAIWENQRLRIGLIPMRPT